MNYRKLWISLSVVIAASFAVLLYFGNDLYHKMPPIPAKVTTPDGTVLYTGQEIRDGQNVWQSTGGQQMGSVWGHGAYVAPDWSADWLHRESVWLLDHWAKQQSGKPYQELPVTDQAALRAKLQGEMRSNTYKPDTGELNYPYLLALVDELGYEGWIGCEYRPRGATRDGLGWMSRWR